MLLVSEYANEWSRRTGAYVTAFFSGLADVDAMTITLSRLAAGGAVSTEVATTGTVVAAIASVLIKAALAWVLGTHGLGRLVSIVLGVVVLSVRVFSSVELSSAPQMFTSNVVSQRCGGNYFTGSEHLGSGGNPNSM